MGNTMAEQKEVELQHQQEVMALAASSKDMPRSTKDIMERLTSMYYKVSMNIEGYASIVLADAKAAQLGKTIATIDTYGVTQGSGRLSQAINTMNGIKETVGYGDSYAKAVSPLIIQTRQIELDVDKIKQDVLVYIEKQRSKIPQIIEMLKQGNSKQASREIAELLNEANIILTKADKLGLDSGKLEDKQKIIFNEMINLLPVEARKGFRVSPASTERTSYNPSEERPR